MAKDLMQHTGLNWLTDFDSTLNISKKYIQVRVDSRRTVKVHSLKHVMELTINDRSSLFLLLTPMGPRAGRGRAQRVRLGRGPSRAVQAPHYMFIMI